MKPTTKSSNNVSRKRRHELGNEKRDTELLIASLEESERCCKPGRRKQLLRSCIEKSKLYLRAISGDDDALIEFSVKVLGQHG